MPTSKNLVLTILLLLGLVYTPQVDAQFENLKELFTFYPNRKAVERDSTLYPSKFIAAPVVSYSPETDFAFGIGAKYLFKFAGSGDETRVSNMPITFQYTLNSQYFLYSGFEIFTNQEKWVIEGNILFQNYPRLYYGIGNGTSESAEEIYNYNQLLVEPIFLKQAFLRHLFIGAGIRYNHIYNTDFEEDGLIATEQLDGFDGSTSVGVEAAALYDSRDVILNASSGWYLEFTHGKYGEFLGGTNKFNLTRIDLRHFLKVSKKNNDVLGFQFVGRTVRNNQPFSEYSFLGSSEIMRGYREGRFIDRDLVAAQAEYRKNFKDSRIGAVVFVGAGDVYRNIDEFQFSSLKPSYGVGVRYKLDESENLNIRLDWGFGRGTNELYLGIAEAF
ncbi:BamA/TamA family outer membrane protein [Nonlabens agnitus]|uniref:Bacterial surface antigen (D15) domain-containing protein n=1 Tax=Nonlabens agnitus TaxID=870484 RepID=A0A2S9WQ84_9FLAO|nr:BamA/TamA family outer membrane protein [Nonlabens agnitus]PRP65640.1 hypothetical protein BST86_00315 [Nonlabens agnitus]